MSQVDRTPVSRLSYANLDCIRLDDGRVMVVPNTPCHRTMEEYVPVAEVERLREAIEAHRTRWQESNGTNPHNALPSDLTLWRSLDDR